MKPRSTSLRRSGFSLPELLVAVVIFGFVMTAVLSGTLLFSRIFASVASTADVQRQERWLEGTLGRDVRMATAITMPADDEFRLVRADGSIASYRLVAQSSGSSSLLRAYDGSTQLLVSGVEAWDVTLPSDDEPFALTLTVAVVSAKGRHEAYRMTSAFTPRSP